MDKVDVGNYGFSIVQIETKSVCNMRCEFCAYPIRKNVGKVLDANVVYSVLDAIEKGKNFEYICFSQFNEPLMDERIYDFIAYAKKLGLPVFLVTNGLMFRSKDIIKKLVDVSPDYVKISLQTANQDLFRRSRKVEIPFREYQEWIYDYLKSVEKSNSSTMVNVDVACNFLNIKRKIKTSLFGVDKGDPSVYEDINDLRSDMKAFLMGWQDISCRYKYVEKAFDAFLGMANISYLEQDGFPISERIFLKIKQFMYGRKLEKFHPIGVMSGCSNRMLGILADGNVVPCCLLYDNSISMGNVNTQGLRTILNKNRKFLRDLREGKNMPKICRRCSGAPTRRGVFFKNLRNILDRVRSVKSK